MSDGLIGIGEAASRVGLAESTLRYWEERGLVSPAQRRGRWRRYGPDELHRIALVQIWRDTGLMSLDEIAAVLAGTVLDGTVRERDWRDVVTGRVHVIEEQQRRLAAAKQHLEHLLSCPDDNPADNCPYLRASTAEQTREAGKPRPARRTVPSSASTSGESRARPTRA